MMMRKNKKYYSLIACVSALALATPFVGYNIAKADKLYDDVVAWYDFDGSALKNVKGGSQAVAIVSGLGDYSGEVKYDVGDNIYEPSNDGFIQHENSNHFEWDKEHDLSGKNVLICDEFYYFGVKNALKIEKDIFPFIIPRCKKIALNDASSLIDYIRDRFIPGIIKNKQ